MIGFAAVAAASFLPARWVSIPAWRVALTNDFGIALPGTITPQPWLTADCLVVLISALLWLYYVTARDADVHNARAEFRIFVASMILLSGVCVVAYIMNKALPFWHNQRGFGPFPNRNQTGDLFAICSVAALACAHDDLRRTKKTWAFWLAGLAVLIVALFLNFSRAGIAIAVLGIAAWLAVITLRRASGMRVAVAGSALLVLLSGILLFGGRTLDRFNFRGTVGEGVSSDFRWLIFHDTATLIRATPWTGLGLGSFSSVFAFFRDASRAESRALHPESDWLWLWSEAGWPAVLLCLAGAAVWIARVYPLAERTNQRLRLAAAIGALLFALHGLVDVSAHRLGTALTGLFLAGFATHREHQHSNSASTKLIFRSGGLLLLVVSGTILAATSKDLFLPGSVGVGNAKRAALTANREHRFADAIGYSTAALKWAPLDWELYFVRAVAELSSGRPVAVVLDDFRRARFLEPNSYQIPLEEGRAWVRSQPLLAIVAWREALKRAEKNRAEIYDSMLSTASLTSPDVARALEELGFAHPDLAVTHIARLSGAALDSAVRRLLERNPTLNGFDAAQKRKVFSEWAQKGDVDGLIALTDQHPEWLEFAWTGVAKAHARRGDYRSAVRLAQRFIAPPTLPPVDRGSSIQELQKAVYSNVRDYDAGFALIQEQRRVGRPEDALMTVRHFTEQENCPGYFQFLEGELWLAKGDWQHAWTAFERFAQGARKD